jgi:hypothetical protein
MACCGLMPQWSDPTGIGETRKRRESSKFLRQPFLLDFKRQELKFELLFCLCSCGLFGSDQSDFRTHTHTHASCHTQHTTHTHQPTDRPQQSKAVNHDETSLKTPRNDVFPVHSEPFLCLLIGPLTLYLYPPIYGCLFYLLAAQSWPHVGWVNPARPADRLPPAAHAAHAAAAQMLLPPP